MKRTALKILKILTGLLVAGIVVWAAYSFLIRPWHLTWGATDAEISAVLPGDEYIPQPAGDVITRVITIQASPAEIWPWLVQLGADKGGLYSYTALERVIFCPQTNADRLHPEWQGLQVGELVKLCPKDPGPPPYHVVAIEPERALILGQPALTEQDKAPGVGWMNTWALVLEPVDAGTTRLIQRTRNAADFGWMKLIEPGVFIMERGMMRGIQARAEQ